jgi:glycosyltransferase involved in cell wall biosynthesis
LNIVVLTNYKLSEKKGAAYSRIKAYQTALKNKFIFYVVEFDTFKNQNNKHSFITCDDGIKYIKSTPKRFSLIYRVLFVYFDFINSLKANKYIKNNFNNNETKVLVYSSHFFLLFYAIFYLGKLKGFKIIVEKNEIEIGIIQSNLLPQSLKFSFLLFFILPIRWIFALLSDMIIFFAYKIIVISSKLERLYKFSNNLYRVPIIVDSERFNFQSPKIKNEFIFAGSITRNKDGLFELVNAVGIYKNQFKSDFIINIIGDGNRSVLIQLNNLILKHNLSNHVRLLPSMSSSDIPEILNKAQFGFLIRKKTLQNHFGFSTKLGEYLSAGLFVITTDVSDNRLYLKNLDNCFFMEKVDSLSIFKAINYCCKILPSRLKEIELENKLIAKKYFSIDSHHSTLLKIFS